VTIIPYLTVTSLSIHLLLCRTRAYYLA